MSAGIPNPMAPVAPIYNTIAASQSAQILSKLTGGTTGALGDYLSKLIITPATTAPGVVTVLDGAVSIAVWLGGTVGTDLKPFTIDINTMSATGAWKITTGANVSVIATGAFS